METHSRIRWGFRHMPPSKPQPKKHEVITKSIAGNIKCRRLDLNMTQSDLASASEVPLPTYRKFERTGLISLMGFIRIGIALGAEKELETLLAKRPKKQKMLLPKRQRARKKGVSANVVKLPQALQNLEDNTTSAIHKIPL